MAKRRGRLEKYRSRSAEDDNNKEDVSDCHVTSVQAQNCARMLYNRSHVKFSQILDEFVNNYRQRPADMTYWPYGPYWPLSDSTGTLYNTPVLCRDSIHEREPLWNEILGKRIGRQPGLTCT